MSEKISIEKLTDLVTAIKFKVDATNEQIINISMLMEFVIEKLGEQNIKLDVEEFPEFAKQKYEELAEIAQKAIDEGIQDDIREHIQRTKEQIDLTE